MIAPLTLAAALVLGAAPARAFDLGFLDPFNLFGPSEEEKAAAELPDPVRYEVTVNVSPDEDDLQDKMEAASSLKADEDEPVSGSLGLLAKAKGDRRRLVGTLYENARYDGLVTIRIEGQDIATLAPDATFDTSRPVPVTIDVTPGPLFQIGTVRIDANGVPIDPARYELTPGSSADSVRILQIENRIVQDLRNEGRPFVAVTKRDVVADSATDRIDVAISLSPGEVLPFGQTFVTGTERMDPGFVAYMTGIRPGETYSPQALEKARERLRKLNVFSTATIREATPRRRTARCPSR